MTLLIRTQSWCRTETNHFYLIWALACEKRPKWTQSCHSFNLVHGTPTGNFLEFLRNSKPFWAQLKVYVRGLELFGKLDAQTIESLFGNLNEVIQVNDGLEDELKLLRDERGKYFYSTIWPAIFGFSDFWAHSNVLTRNLRYHQSYWRSIEELGTKIVMLCRICKRTCVEA